MPVSCELMRVPKPLKLTNNQSETDIQASVADALDILLLPPAFWFAMPLGHANLAPHQRARFVRIGARRGLPDIWAIYDGKVYGVELKRPGGRLSKTRRVRTRRGTLRTLEGQDVVFERLRQSGMTIAVCESVPSVLKQLAEWGIPLRRHTI